MRLPALISILLFVVSCNPSVRPIEYGLDTCDFCKMSVADSRFAAEIVSDKGKVYTYDAIECMVNALHDHPAEQLSAIVVMDFNNPNSWINATAGFYVINSKIQSPMGANLACFSSEAEAKSALNISSDSILNWNSLKSKRFTFDDQDFQK